MFTQTCTRELFSNKRSQDCNCEIIFLSLLHSVSLWFQQEEILVSLLLFLFQQPYSPIPKPTAIILCTCLTFFAVVLLFVLQSLMQHRLETMARKSWATWPRPQILGIKQRSASLYTKQTRICSLLHPEDEAEIPSPKITVHRPLLLLLALYILIKWWKLWQPKFQIYYYTSTESKTEINSGRSIPSTWRLMKCWCL